MKMVKKLEGSIGWVGYGDADDGEVHRIILRGSGELSIDVTCEGYRYAALLNSVGGSQYAGQWRCQEGRHTYVDDVSCTLYTSEEGVLLFGKWREDGANHYWWAKLNEVEHFADEKHAQQGVYGSNPASPE